MPVSHLPEQMDVLSNQAQGDELGTWLRVACEDRLPLAVPSDPYLVCGAEIAPSKVCAKFPTSVSPPGFKYSSEHWSLEVEKRYPWHL